MGVRWRGEGKGREDGRREGKQDVPENREADVNQDICSAACDAEDACGGDWAVLAFSSIHACVRVSRCPAADSSRWTAADRVCDDERRGRTKERDEDHQNR